MPSHQGNWKWDIINELGIIPHYDKSGGNLDAIDEE